jgi:hypothetical protein
VEKLSPWIGYVASRCCMRVTSLGKNGFVADRNCFLAVARTTQKVSEYGVLFRPV